MQEIWKPIKDFEGLYEVSNMGNVRSLNYRCTGEIKILKLCKDKDGYMVVNLYKNKKLYRKSVHRLVAATFIPNIDNKPQVNHIDGDKTNNRVSNLEWCTNSENQHHAWATGLKKITEEHKRKIGEANKGKYKGENNPQSRQVRCITTDETFNCMIEGATKYNVDPSHISKCCKGKAKSAGKNPVTGEKLKWEYVEVVNYGKKTIRYRKKKDKEIIQ